MLDLTGENAVHPAYFGIFLFSLSRELVIPTSTMFLSTLKVFQMNKCKFAEFECAHGSDELGCMSWVMCHKKCDYALLKLGDMKTVSTVLFSTAMFVKNEELKRKAVKVVKA